MATVTGLTAARMLEIEAASVVDGDVSGDDLILTRQDGSIINAGNVRGGPGPEGPMGSALEVVTAKQLLEVGQVDQIRAGRQLTAADFTAMGLSAPIGLWNLSNANDSSGNARHLSIKGGVPFGAGINGLASTAAVFAGSTAQALYIPDTGAADPFRIRTGTFGMWYRNAKRGLAFDVFSKYTGVVAASSFLFESGSANNMIAFLYDGTTFVQAPTNSDVMDDQWHFLVLTIDGTVIRWYIDASLDSEKPSNLLLNANASAPLNIGGSKGDAATATQSPAYGRVDEAFITGDVLTEDHIRNLYSASIPHALGVTPSVIRLAVRRKRRGSPRVVTDYPAQPVRLYNFVNGAMTDQGSNNVPLTNPNAFPAVGGPDGTPLNAIRITGVAGGLQGTDAGLPSALNPRSYELWFKTKTITGNMWLMSWSSLETSLWMSLGTIRSFSGPDSIVGPSVADGEWHQAVEIEDNLAADGLKRKLYIDAKLAGSSTVMTSTALQGANKFRIGSYSDGSLPFTGDISRVAIYAGVLTPENVRSLFNAGLQVLAPSPKVDADHIEAVEGGRLLAMFDTLESNHLIDLAVMS